MPVIFKGISLQFVKNILVEFCPWEANVQSARQFLSRVGSSPVRETNPKCLLNTKIKNDGSPPSVTVLFDDGKQLIFKSRYLTSTEMLQRLGSLNLQRKKTLEQSGSGRLPVTDITYVMMEADVRWCPNCKLKGERKHLRLFQINDDLAAVLCDNEKCVNLGEISSVSSLILQRKSSEIPNTKRKKRRLNPAPSSNTKMPNSTSNPVQPSSFSYLNIGDTQSSPVVPSVSSGSPYALSTQSDRLLTTPSLKTMPEVLLWRNKSALCWLDSCMCVLVLCQNLRACLVRLPEKSIIRTLCREFDSVQNRPCVLGISANINKVNGHSSKSSKVDPEFSAQYCSETDATSNISDQLNLTQISSGMSHTAVSHKLYNVHHQEAISNDREPTLMDHQPNDKSAVKSDPPATDDDVNTLLDPLNKIRDKLFQRLQTKLKCQVGQEESLVSALPLLLHLDESVEEHFLCRYHWELYCTVCGHADVNVNKKTIPTFTSVPADFNMTDPVMLTKCPHCGSQNQKSHLVFHSFPACVMMHFQDGLPDSDLTRHNSFIQGGDTYVLSVVIQYRQNPNHFVTLIRDQESNYWLEYDDILPSPFTWKPQPPCIPANNIHMMMWERVKKPCTVCVTMHSDLTALRDSLAKSTLSCVPEGKMNPVTQQNTASHWNSKSISKDSELTSHSLHQSEAEHPKNTMNIKNTAESSKGAVLSGNNIRLNEAITNTKIQRTVIDLTSETNISTADVPVSTRSESSNNSPLNIQLEANAKGISALSEGPLSVALSRLRRFRPSVTRKNTESSKQTDPVIATNINTTAKPKAQTQRRPQTFLDQIKSRRKCNIEEDKSTKRKSNTSLVLGRIPEQLLKFSGTGTLNKIAKVQTTNIDDEAQRNGTSLKSERVSKNVADLSKVPKQVNSCALSQQVLMPHSQYCVQVPRPQLLGPLSRGTTKQAKFRPYSLANQKILQEENKEVTTGHSNGKNIGILNSWQKRVGMYTNPTTTTRKRIRRDSMDESINSDQTKLAWYPTSSVSSPSACSDISSLSDNQSFVSGRDDLANTIDELCKVFGNDYSCTPSVSSRFSSPSQDMFSSELLADEASSLSLDNTGNDDFSFESSKKQITLMSHEDQTAFAMHTQVTPSPVLNQSPLLTRENSAQRDVIGDNLSQNTVPTANISSCTDMLEGTLPSVEPTMQVMNQSAVSPSCVHIHPTVNTVAMQQHMTKSNHNVGGFMTCMQAPFNSLSDCTTGGITDSSLTPNEANIERFCDIDDITGTQLFDNNLDFLENEWSSNFVELLA